MYKKSSAFMSLNSLKEQYSDQYYRDCDWLMVISVTMIVTRFMTTQTEDKVCLCCYFSSVDFDQCSSVDLRQQQIWSIYTQNCIQD